MKIKSFLPSKIIACMECFGLYVTLVYLFVELKLEKHEAVIYLCFLYGVICLGLTVIFYNLRRVYFYREIYYRKLIIFLEVLKCRQSLMFQGFPAFLVTEDVLKSP